jgi:hypothetical protein
MFSILSVMASMRPTMNEDALQMCKSACRESSMSDATITDADELVAEARGWSAALLARVYTGPGDTLEAAMHRAERKYGVPAQAFWSLRYRKPKDILASVYLRLKAAYEHEVARQEAKLAHELALTKEMLGDAAPTNPIVAQADAALRAAKGQSEEDEAA